MEAEREGGFLITDPETEGRGLPCCSLHHPLKIVVLEEFSGKKRDFTCLTTVSCLRGFTAEDGAGVGVGAPSPGNAGQALLRALRQAGCPPHRPVLLQQPAVRRGGPGRRPCSGFHHLQVPPRGPSPDRLPQHSLPGALTWAQGQWGGRRVVRNRRLWAAESSANMSPHTRLRCFQTHASHQHVTKHRNCRSSDLGGERSQASKPAASQLRRKSTHELCH